LEHREAAPLLIDHVRGRLDGEPARTVAAHVAACEECRALAETIRRVDGEITTHGAALFERHPTADDLARWALGSASALPTEILARIGAHVNACPTCGREAALARRAAAPSFLASLAARARGWTAEGAAGWLRPALAAVAILLAWPAWQGLVEVPALRREVTQMRSQLDAAREREATPPERPTPAFAGGAARILVLGGPTRSAADGPTVTPAPGQTALPIVVDLESSPELLSSDGDLDVRIVPTPRGEPAFAMLAPAASLRDPATRTLTLLVPLSRLGPGTWRLEIRRGALGVPLYTAPFRVAG
jgi:anti-sigma factor ChrR (cupin superfamily)